MASEVNLQAARLRELVRSRPPRSSRAEASTMHLWLTSGKGGTGRSTIAHNVALALSRLGRRVGLVDPDVAFVNGSAWNAVHRAAVWAFDGRSSDAVAAAAHDDLAEPRELWILDGAFEGMAGFLPTPHRTLWLVITTPDPAASAGAFLMADNLARERQESFALITNRVASPRHGRVLGERLRHVLHDRAVAQPVMLECVTDDPALAASVRCLEPLLARPASTPAGHDLTRVARKLLSLAGPEGH